jgi:WD repeat-containing protein 48
MTVSRYVVSTARISQFMLGSLSIMQDDQTKESEPETEQSRFLGSLVSQGFYPPSATDAPPLSLPSNTELVLAEETQSGWSNIYRGTVASTGHDSALLEKVMPLWLMQYLLANKIPVVPNIKVSFGVALWSGKSAAGESTEALNPCVTLASPLQINRFTRPFLYRPSRLTANRYLRVRKILAYVCIIFVSWFCINLCYNTVTGARQD